MAMGKYLFEIDDFGIDEVIEPMMIDPMDQFNRCNDKSSIDQSNHHSSMTFFRAYLAPTNAPSTLQVASVADGKRP